MHRRNFLQTCVGTAGAAALLPLTQTVHAASPIGNRNAPAFRISLAAYSFRESLLKTKDREPTMTLHDFIDFCAETNIDGAELTGYYMPDPPTPEYLHDLRAHCFRAGIAVSGTAIRSDFGWPSDSEEMAKELDHVRRWIDYAAELHAPVIRIFAGHPKKGADAESTHQRMVEGIAKSCAYAGQRGIYLGLENHGGPTETAAGVLKLLESVDSPWLAVNLDTGNFRGEVDPYEQMAMLAPYAVNVQVKVVLTTPDGKKQPMDYKKVAGILRKANYRGFVALEYEEKGDVKAECRENLKLMREALAEV